MSVVCLVWDVLPSPPCLFLRWSFTLALSLHPLQLVAFSFPFSFCASKGCPASNGSLTRNLRANQKKPVERPSLEEIDQAIATHTWLHVGNAIELELTPKRRRHL